MNLNNTLVFSACLMMTVLTGCAGKSAVSSSSSPGTSSRPAMGGVKPAGQVAPCCRQLAEGRISLDRCMENPACIANNRSCCMNAF